MSLWLLEWLRLVRTRRIFALLGVFWLFAVVGPFTARYAGELLERLGGGIEVTLPEAIPADGMIQYVDNALQLGLLTAVIVAAGALALDSQPTIGVFFRTRVASLWRLLWPRYLVSTLAALAAFASGSLLAWYETRALLGAPDAAATAAGVGYASLYLAFAIALVAAYAGAFRTALGAVLATLGTLLTMPIAGLLPMIEDWLPSRLVGATSNLLLDVTGAADYFGAAAVTVVGTVLALRAAVWGAGRREL